jgi:hypothetical protein
MAVFAFPAVFAFVAIVVFVAAVAVRRQFQLLVFVLLQFLWCVTAIARSLFVLSMQRKIGLLVMVKFNFVPFFR